jgi:CheY-like chemotaxis protein
MLFAYFIFMKILIIDDDQDIRKIARIALQRVGGWEVVEAAGSEQGLQEAAKQNPDVILLDVMMPAIDGPATLAKIQQNPEINKIPVIFLTAKAMPSELERLKSLGARGVISKPFRAMALVSEIQAILQQKQERLV